MFRSSAERDGQILKKIKIRGLTSSKLYVSASNRDISASGTGEADSRAEDQDEGDLHQVRSVELRVSSASHRKGQFKSGN
jgi:hypothetical protein